MQLTKSPDDLIRFVAAEVRAAMARQQISQQALADRAGWTQSYIARRLVGRTPFDIADLGRLANLLGVPLASFLPAATDEPVTGGKPVDNRPPNKPKTGRAVA